jgi:hypothetical protein
MPCSNFVVWIGTLFTKVEIQTVWLRLEGWDRMWLHRCVIIPTVGNLSLGQNWIMCSHTACSQDIWTVFKYKIQAKNMDCLILIKRFRYDQLQCSHLSPTAQNPDPSHATKFFAKVQCIIYSTIIHNKGGCHVIQPFHHICITDN